MKILKELPGNLYSPRSSQETSKESTETVHLLAVSPPEFTAESIPFYLEIGGTVQLYG